VKKVSPVKSMTYNKIKQKFKKSEKKVANTLDKPK